MPRGIFGEGNFSRKFAPQRGAWLSRRVSPCGAKLARHEHGTLPPTIREITMDLHPRTIALSGANLESGHCWWVELPAEVPDGDGPDYPPRSCLHLMEDGIEVGPAYVWHNEIRELGGGRYSHWGRKLYFSTSDNSSPLENGRFYSILLNDQAPPNGEDVTPVNIAIRSKQQIQEAVDYAIQIARSHLERLSAFGLKLEGLRILELGPGVNFAPQLVMASMGARVAVADRFRVSWNDEYHPAFYRAFRERWGHPVSAIDRVLNDGAHSDEVISSFASPAEDLAAISSASFDLVISNAVLEHVYSMPAVCSEMARVTAPGGLNLHQIDFRDHHDFTRPLEFLTMPDDEFKALFDWKNGERGNRWRPSETQREFERAGFELLEVEVNAQTEPSYLEEFLPRLRAASSSYRDWPQNDLMILGAFLKMRRKQS